MEALERARAGYWIAALIAASRPIELGLLCALLDVHQLCGEDACETCLCVCASVSPHNPLMEFMSARWALLASEQLPC